MLLLSGLKITSSLRHGFFLCSNHNISWQQSDVLAHVCPNLLELFFFFFFKLKEPCIHNSLKLAVYVVVVVVFVIKLSLIGTNCTRQKVNRDFHHSELKKLTLKWSVAKWKDKTAKSSP